MKKIAIITFHRVMNCGAMLQAYALQNYCTRFIETSILDYRNDKFEIRYGYKKSISKHLKDIIKYIVRYKPYIETQRRRKRFIRFSKDFLQVTAKYNAKNINHANKQYDAFIAGSDQVWNPKWSNGDWNYFLSFADNEKRYSYAASFGTKIIESEYRTKIKSELSCFQQILLRELRGTEIAEDLALDKAITHLVCDPVFLLSKEEWIRNFGLKQTQEDYVFVYFAASQTRAVEFARNLAKQHGLRVYYLNSFNLNNIDSSFHLITDAGPREFLQLIYNARFVVTTSFHAMAFSLLFEKLFFYELNHTGDNDNSRLESLAEICNVHQCEIIDSIPTKTTWDWDKISLSLNNYRKESEAVLKNMLDMIESK